MATSVKLSKDALEQAYTSFKKNKLALSRAITNANNNVNSSMRTLKIKITSLEDSLDKLNSCHTLWVSKAELSEEMLAAEMHSNTWLENIWEEVDGLCDKANDILQQREITVEPQGLSAAQKLLILEKQMDSLHQNITNEVDLLIKNTAEESLNPASHAVYTEMMSRVSNQLESSFVELSNSILALSGAKVEEVVSQHELFRQKQQQQLVNVQVNLANRATLSTANSSDTLPKVSADSTSYSHSIQMEKCKAPTFSGKTIDYPEFKRGWQKIAGTVWDDDNQIEQLKHKVDTYTRKIVSRCKEMNEVWDSLDKEYGQEQEVVNAVNTELKVLKAELCTTPEYIVKLRNFLPGLEEALRSVDGLEHLQTPDKVNFLVEKFDERTQYDWEYFKSKESGKTYDRFFKFILDRYDSCRSTIARLRSYEMNEKGIKMCESCQHAEHSTRECPKKEHVNHQSVQISCFKCQRWVAKEGSLVCPACGNNTPQGQLIGHCLEHCSKYEAMSANQRSDCVKSAKWCPVHLSSTHDFQSCTQKNDPRLICGINGCGKHHHRSLHGSTNPFVVEINSLSFESNIKKRYENRKTDKKLLDSNVLLSMQEIPTPSGKVNCFFDNGSTCCLILHSTAKRLGLRGEPVVINICTVNGEQEMKTELFYLNLIEIEGVQHTIKAFGVSAISGVIDTVKLDVLKLLFSPTTQEVWNKVDARPSGEVELLIGQNYAGLHPTEHETSGNVKVMRSIFGSGYTISGCHDSISSSGVVWDTTVASIRTNKATSDIHATRVTFQSVREYLDSNDLSVPTPRRCKNCMNCNECSFRGHQMSLQEQYEYKIMEDNVEYDEANNVFRIRYPFIEDPSILTYNLGQVIKIAEREEKRLCRENLTDLFNAEFDKMLGIGVLIELSDEEMNVWKGPVHYVSLQHVLNPESTTTPLRIVTNSSLSDRNGNSLNSILMKGPNTLSNQFDVISRWRTYDTALCSDFTKAYFSMQTGELEMHVRRVVWRYGKSDSKWRHFGYKTVTFGDKPAGVFLDIVINKTAERFKEIDPVAAEKIKNDRYVDDLVTGGTAEEVQRFEGISGDNFETNGTISQILSHGSLRLKAVVKSGEQDAEKIKKLGRNVLGLGWDPKSDLVEVDLQGSNSSHSLDDPPNIVLSKRTILGIVNKPYDLLGLVSPITIQLRVAYRDLFRLEPPLDWDDNIPPNEQAKWISLLNLLNEVNSITFPRATKPKNAMGSPEVVGYFDGSDNAYAAVVYFRWILEDGSVDVRLASSKSKVTPLKRISTPRAELNGAVLLSRLVLSLIKSWAVAGIIPSKVWLFGDSECTLSSIEKTTGAFGEYFGNRVGEIIDNQAQIENFCDVGVAGEWWYVPSELNAADQPTKITSTLKDVDLDSPWQKGPSYLYLPRENWPVNRNFAERKGNCIPSNEILKKYRGIVQEVRIQVNAEVGVHNLLDPFSTNDWLKLVHRTQLLLLPFFRKRKIFDVAARFEAAEILWFKQAMKDTAQAWSDGRLDNLCVEEKDGMVVVVGRASTGLQKLLGKEYLPVIMAQSRIGMLIMLWAHYQNHDGRDITMSIACKKAWIVNAKNLANSICYHCIRCRFLHRLKVQQRMAMLPAEIQVPCPPFSNIGVDLCGPLTVHSMTNKRATLKVWNVIFVCLNTKAVTMYLAPGYSTDDFMLAYNSHISDHGLPNRVHSDKGSQLVAAGKEVTDFEWEAIAKKASVQGTNWTFAPAGGQWRNGAVEIFVKKFKKSFEVLYGKTRMNYAEMSCAVKRIANVLNDRPLSVQKSHSEYPDTDFLTPITPNMLITGRSGSLPPVERDDADNIPQERLSFIAEIERAWWYQYKVQYFTSLVPTQRWTKAKRNMCPGDVVLIEYKNKSFPGTYRLGRVKEVETGPSDDLVRTCTVIYKLIKSSSATVRNVLKDITTKEVRVPVQRLVLILPIEEQ